MGVEKGSKVEKNISNDFQKILDNINEKKIDGLNEGELKEIFNVFKGLSSSELIKFKSIIKESFIDGTKGQLLDLMKDIEKSKNNKSYENIRESNENNESMKELFKVFDVYFENKISEIKRKGGKKIKFSEKEISNIKLLIFNDFQDIFSIKGQVGKILNEIGGYIKGITNNFEKNDNTKKVGLKEAYKKINTLISDFGKDDNTKKGVLEYIDSKIGNSFNKINELKQEKITDEKFDEIKNKTVKIAENFKGASDIKKSLIGMMNELPDGFGEKISGFLENIIKDYPILGLLFGIIFGKDFLSNNLEGKKRLESINNLIEFSKEENSNIIGLNLDYFKDFDIKKLNIFFTFLEKKGIKGDIYSKKGFWKEFLAGKSENQKILKVHNLLKGKDGKVNFSDEEKKGEGFIKKLNGLKGIENKENSKKRKEKIEKLKEKIKNSKEVTNIQNLNLKDKKVSLQKTKEILKKIEFEDSIMNIKKIPTNIIYEGKSIELDIESGNILKLGGKIYEIKINHGDNDIFKSLSFDGNLKLTTTMGGGFLSLTELTTDINNDELIGLLSGLLKDGSYSKPIEGKEGVKLEINAIS